MLNSTNNNKIEIKTGITTGLDSQFLERIKGSDNDKDPSFHFVLTKEEFEHLKTFVESFINKTTQPTSRTDLKTKIQEVLKTPIKTFIDLIGLPIVLSSLNKDLLDFIVSEDHDYFSFSTPFLFLDPDKTKAILSCFKVNKNLYIFTPLTPISSDIVLNLFNHDISSKGFVNVAMNFYTIVYSDELINDFLNKGDVIAKKKFIDFHIDKALGFNPEKPTIN
jgi:hypothetical protein